MKERATARSEVRSHRQQHTVLVDVVQSVNAPQNVVTPALGLQGIDGRHRCRRHQRRLFRLGRLVFDGRVGDREGHALERARLTRADQHELIREMVEGSQGRCVANLGDAVDQPAASRWPRPARW
jgi:hypothetical protein